MNKWIGMGRLCRDPEMNYVDSKQMNVARYRLAVDGRGEDDVDFINCVAFYKGADFAEKYLRQGMKILVTGRIKTGSYDKEDGTRVYTTDIIVDTQEFCESKKTSEENASVQKPTDDKGDGFMNIPDQFTEDDLPFA